MNDKIQTIQQCYAEFGKGNVQGILDLLDDNVIWTDPGYPELPASGRRQGKAEVMDFFKTLSLQASFTRFEPQQFFNDGNFVFAKGYYAGTSNETGRFFESDWMMMWEVVDGKVKSYQNFNDTLNSFLASNRVNEKVQLVKECYAEFGKGNPQGVLDRLADDVVWIDPGYPEIPYAGKRTKKEDVMDFFTGINTYVTLTRFEPREFHCDGNNVLVKGYFEGTSNSTGKAFQSSFMMDWEVVDGKIKSYEAFLDTTKVANAIRQVEAVVEGIMDYSE